MLGVGWCSQAAAATLVQAVMLWGPGKAEVHVFTLNFEPRIVANTI